MAVTWPKTGELVLDDDGNPTFTFRNIPAGTERLEVHITHIAENEFGSLTIHGIWMDKPINARRLKALPLDGLRTQCERLLRERRKRFGMEFARVIFQDVLGKTTPELDAALSTPQAPINDLATLASGDKHSDEFLEAVAKVARDARKHGKSAWKAVRDAIQGAPRLKPGEIDRVGEATAQRYIKRADERAAKSTSKREAARFNTGTLKRTTDKVTPIRLVKGGDE